MLVYTLFVYNYPQSCAIRQEAYPEVPNHDAVTRRLQFGLKDEKDEKKADKKKERKRKQNNTDGEEATTCKKKKKSKKSKVSRKKVKTQDCQTKKRRGKGLKNLETLRLVKQSSPSPKKKTPEKTPIEKETTEEEPSGSNEVAPAKKINKKGKAKQDWDELPKAIIDSYTKKIEVGIKKCCDNNCEHSWEISDFVVSDKYQISAYWSRSAIGVKISNDLLSEDASKRKKKTDKKTGKTVPKSKNFSQVGYFACGCIYMSMVAAHTLAL